jgi:ABC-2 type transport system ATP-binding protein
MPGAVLNVNGLTRRFGGRVAVNDVSFDVFSGEVLGLLGPNGAGKTTTLLCMAGLLRPNAGTLTYAGKVLGAERGRIIALVPETPDVYDMLTVWEHLVFVARSLELEPGWERRAEELLSQLAIADERNTLGSALSKGMRQKTLLATTILADAPVLLLDEPLVGLDPRGQRELRELILRLRSAGKAVVLSTHLMESAEALCDRAIILKGGSVIASGSMAELHAGSASTDTLEDVFLRMTS